MQLRNSEFLGIPAPQIPLAQPTRSAYPEIPTSNYSMIEQSQTASFDEYEDLACFAYAVGNADEGVCLLVRMGPYRILLDCGLADISVLLSGEHPPADFVLCSHAHSDHARGLLALHQAFPQLPIYASEVTTQLLPLNWSRLSPDMPLFCQALPWRSPVEFAPGLSAELLPAGHLPGAAVILLTYSTANHTYRIVYTGDFFLSNSRLVEGLPLEQLRGFKPDVLIVEGSYGTARHPHRRQQENQLVEKITEAIAQKQSILMPMQTLGLGQEILMLLRSHHLFTGRDLDIWVDGTVADGCDAYLDILPHFPSAVQNFARHQPLFWDDRVRPRVRRLRPEQRNLLNNSPCILLVDETADFTDYCQAGSKNWMLLLAQKPGNVVKINPALFTAVETYLLAQHCDGLGTTQLIHNLRPQHVIFCHGSPGYLADLTGLEELQNRYHLHTPYAQTLVELPIGETFLQPAPPTETNYEGEVIELDSVVMITLPDTITVDSRWSKFADTGLVEVRWQGEELVLRGLSPRELLSRGNDARIPLNVECCGNCLYQRGQRCWNLDSPLYEFKVTPDGFCPVFTPVLLDDSN